MKIKIAPENAEALEAALVKVNGKSSSHTYDSFFHLDFIATDAEAILEHLKLPKRIRSGAEVVSISGGRVPNSYKYARRATLVTLTRGSSAWFLTPVKPATVYKEGGGPDRLYLTKEQDCEAVSNFRSQYKVRS